MRTRILRLALPALIVAAHPLTAWAGESRLVAEFRLQFSHLKESCGAVKTAATCATSLVTGRPIKITFGGVAPGNGPAVGIAYGTSWAQGPWRMSWNNDTIRTLGGSWRAGSYLTLIHTPAPRIGTAASVATATTGAAAAPRPKTTFNIYAQRTSVQDLSFFGIGPSTLKDDRTAFGLTQGIIGASVVAPLAAARDLNLSLLGEINGRFVSLRDGHDTAVPSTFERFSDATAPGLHEQPRFIQLGGGARLTPRINRYLRLDYLASAHRFGSSGGAFTFSRWRLDLDHEIGLFRSSGEPNLDPDATNECFARPTRTSCMGNTRDLGGTIHLRALMVSSSPASGATIPFYFMPTVGGADIRGQRTLAAFENYRFRAPHVLVFQQSFEHSIWGPIGAWVRADQGMAQIERGQLGLGGLRKTVTTGATIRAGGAPALTISYATGGGEGRRLVFSFNAAILGGGSRPSLE